MERFEVTDGKKKYEIVVHDGGKLLIDGTPVHLSSVSSGRLMRIDLDGRSSTVYIQRREENIFQVWIKHSVFELKVEDERARLLSAWSKSSGAVHDVVTVRAPMPGLVLGVHATEGQKIASGGKLITLEAMKMENELHAPIAGEVTLVKVKKGDVVEKDQILIRIQSV